MDAPPPEPDSRNSLRHILATDPSMDDPKPEPPSQANTPVPDDGDAAAQSQSQSQDGSRTATDPEAMPHYTATTTTVRRNANGSVSSVYSGNKIKHLKKDDGIPLWRKDIQYDFLKLVFEDDTRAFTKQSDKTGDQTGTPTGQTGQTDGQTSPTGQTQDGQQAPVPADAPVVDANAAAQ